MRFTPGLLSEAADLSFWLNKFAHLYMPLFFGNVGTAFGIVPVFMSNAAMFLAGEAVVRRQNNDGTT